MKTTLAALTLCGAIASAQNLDVKGTTWAEGSLGIGLGTSTPAARLHVEGGQAMINTTGPFSLYLNGNGECCGATGDTGFGHPSDGVITFVANGAESMRVGTGGVAIGTTSLQGKLTVQGDVNGTSRTNQIYVSSATNPSQRLYIGINGNNGATGGDYASIEYLQELQHWGALALQADGGNVGIGTTAPAYRLDVAGDTITRGWFRTTGAAGLYSETFGNHFYPEDANRWSVRTNNGLKFYDGGWAVRGYVHHDNTGFGLLGNGGSWAVRVPHNSSTVIFDGGWVGIGVTWPAYNLDVAGTARIAGIQLFQKGGNNGTASCDTFCAGTQWGQAGSCAGGFISAANQKFYIPCGYQASSSGSASVTCICTAVP
jgi:hypothetical protein